MFRTNRHSQFMERCGYRLSESGSVAVTRRTLAVLQLKDLYANLEARDIQGVDVRMTTPDYPTPIWESLALLITVPLVLVEIRTQQWAVVAIISSYLMRCLWYRTVAFWARRSYTRLGDSLTGYSSITKTPIILVRRSASGNPFIIRQLIICLACLGGIYGAVATGDLLVIYGTMIAVYLTAITGALYRDGAVVDVFAKLSEKERIAWKISNTIS